MAFLRLSDYIVQPNDDYRLGLARLARGLADIFDFALPGGAFPVGDIGGVGYVSPRLWPNEMGPDEAPVAILLGTFQETRPYAAYQAAAEAAQLMMGAGKLGHVSLWSAHWSVRQEAGLKHVAAIIASRPDQEEYLLVAAGLSSHAGDALLISAARLCGLADETATQRLIAISRNPMAANLLQALEHAGHLPA